MHRVAQLVGQRAHVVVLPEVVQQHVRVHVVGAAVRVGARALALGRIPVEPALVERALQHATCSRRRAAPSPASTCFCASSGVYRRSTDDDERRIQVVVVQVVGDAHHPLAQPQVAVERRQAAGSRRRSGACRPTPGCSARRAPPRGSSAYFRDLRVEQRLLHARVHRRAERAAEAAERAEERRHRRLAVVAVRRACAARA